MFFIKLSTMCFQAIGYVIVGYPGGIHEPIDNSGHSVMCVQTAEISTSPIVAKDGETVYGPWNVVSNTYLDYNEFKGSTAGVLVEGSIIVPCTDEQLKRIPCKQNADLESRIKKLEEAEERTRRSVPYGEIKGNDYDNPFHGRWDPSQKSK